MRILLPFFIFAFCSNVMAQKQYYSELQCVENSKGTNFNRYKVAIDFNEVVGVGQFGKIVVSLLEIGSSLQYELKFLKQSRDQDGLTYWYAIDNGYRNEMFNVVKYQKFDKPILDGKYKYCFVFIKYNGNSIPIYEHSYFSN